MIKCLKDKKRKYQSVKKRIQNIITFSPPSERYRAYYMIKSEIRNKTQLNTDTDVYRF